MATVYVDGQAYNMNGAQNVLHGCLSHGLNLPYFCWHPALGSVGACRQCAVKQFKHEHDDKGRIVMACMTPAAENTRISISDSEAVLFRKSVVEGLMIPHPHDCPVCDEGGECHLQDMTYMTGHDYRRYRFEKRTFQNQNLGPLVNHEMNRCIQCYRCVRYYREYAGGRDLHAFSLRNIVYFGREADGALENEFSGNLVEVCPTGVFTDKTRRFHYTRKWDLTYGPSICVHCGAGCNISAAERYGALRQISNRYNHEVNGYFLCDRGRFGYEYVNSSARIREPRLQGQPVSADWALESLRKIVEAGAIGIGSPRASLESNFALRQLVGASRFYCGIEEAEYAVVRAMISALRAGPARAPSLREIEECDAVLVLGEDLTNTAPRYALAVRQATRQASFGLAAELKVPLWMDLGVRDAAQDLKSPLFLATAAPTRLDDVAAERFHGAPDEIARLGFSVAHALGTGAREVDGVAEEHRRLSQTIAAALRAAKRPVVISGAGLRSEPIVRAAAAVAQALHAAGKPALLAYTTAESNTFGLAMMDPKPLGEALSCGAEGVIVLENDLYRRAPATAVDEFFARAKHVAVLDFLPNATVDKAELVLPAGTFAESDGTLVSSEGRAQRSFQTFVPAGEIQESWRWLGGEKWTTLDEIISATAAEIPALARVAEAAPPASFRVADGKLPRQPHRFSGRTAIYANMTVHEPPPPEDPDSALSFSMEGAHVQPPPALIPFFWSPGWNSIQSVNRFQDEIAGILKGGVPGVRLIEPAAARDGAISALAPPAFTPRTDEWLLVPLYHIFGSDPLSMASPATASLAPEPYVALNREDAARLGVGEGQPVSLAAYRLPVRIVPELPRGVAGVPFGLTPISSTAPAWSAITP